MIAIGVFDGDDLFTCSKQFKAGTSKEEMLKAIIEKSGYEDPSMMVEFLIVEDGTSCEQVDLGKVEFTG